MTNSTTTLKVSSFGKTDVGLIRKNNEDVFIAMKKHNFFLLADGMGGHKAGEVAAQETAVYLCHCIKKLLTSEHQLLSAENLADKLKEFIEFSNTRIYQLGKEHKAFSGMGTTLCSILFFDNFLIQAHVGDSRIYRYRANDLKQLTTDHTLINKLIANGALDKSYHGKKTKNVLTKAIGAYQAVTPEISVTPVLPGDLYMLCSDGLTDLVSNQEISSILNSSASIESTTLELIESAKEKGGNDNITVLITKVEA